MMTDHPSSAFSAAKLHEHVPPGWYEESIRSNVFQRYWHRRRIREIRKIALPADDVLDLGVADGLLTSVIAQATRARRVLGIDVVEHSIRWAQKRWADTNVMRFEVGDAHNLRFPDASFDAVFSLEMLEHVFDPAQVLSEIRRVLRPGGYIVLLVPSDSRLFRCIWYVWTRTRGAIWKDTHIQTFRNRALSSLIRRAGFTPEIDRTFLCGMLHIIRARR